MIPVNVPSLDGNEARYLAECIETGWISADGPFVHRLEEGMAEVTGRRHAIAVCNGSAALDAAVGALQLGPGDEVILPTFTIISCALAIVRSGATPVVVDCEPDTWNLDVAQVEAALTPRTRAIMAVHVYGLPVDMDPLLELAARHDLRIIEDAAEAIGQTYRSLDGRLRPCGGIGGVSTFSFYSNKHVTCGEGGMVLTDDDALAERTRSLRNLCFGPVRFVHEEMGYNFRMSNLQAAVGVAQLERLEQSVARKREIGARYSERLAGRPALQCPLPRTPHAENVYWVYGVVLDDAVPFDAAEAMERLTDAGVETRPFFRGMHEQPALRRRGLFPGVRCPVAERLSRRGFYLPAGLALKDDEIDRVVKAVDGLFSP